MSHREERVVAHRDQPALAREIQRLAESGDFEGFNAVIGEIERKSTFDAVAIDFVKRDPEFRNRITDTCREAWRRKQSSP
jgi:hypothetical protein